MDSRDDKPSGEARGGIHDHAANYRPPCPAGGESLGFTASKKAARWGLPRLVDTTAFLSNRVPVTIRLDMVMTSPPPWGTAQQHIAGFSVVLQHGRTRAHALASNREKRRTTTRNEPRRRFHLRQNLAR